MDWPALPVRGSSRSEGSGTRLPEAIRNWTVYTVDPS